MTDDNARRAQEQYLLEATQRLLTECAAFLHGITATVEDMDGSGGAVYTDVDGRPRCRFGCSYGRRSPHIMAKQGGPVHTTRCPATTARPLLTRVTTLLRGLDAALLGNLPPLSADEVGAIVGPLWIGHDVPHISRLGLHERELRRAWFQLQNAMDETKELRRRLGLPGDNELNKSP